MSLYVIKYFLNYAKDIMNMWYKCDKIKFCNEDLQLIKMQYKTVSTCK